MLDGFADLWINGQNFSSGQSRIGTADVVMLVKLDDRGGSNGNTCWPFLGKQGRVSRRKYRSRKGVAHWRFGEVLCTAIRLGRKVPIFGPQMMVAIQSTQPSTQCIKVERRRRRRATNQGRRDRLHFIACTMRGTATQPRDTKTNGSRCAVSLDACAGLAR